MDNLTLKDILDLGVNGLSIVGLWLLWGRLTVVTDRLFSYLEQAKDERHKMRNELQAVKTSTEVLEQKAKNGT